MVTNQLFGAEVNGGAFDEAREACDEFIISSGDTPELFKFSEHAPDLIALLIEVFVIIALGYPVAFRRDTDIGSSVLDRFDQHISIIRFVG